MNSEKNIHKESAAARIRDDDDYTKLKSWFEDHNPFEAGEGLFAVDTGLTDVKGKITCDRAKEIGAFKIKSLGKVFLNGPLKRKVRYFAVSTQASKLAKKSS